MFYYSVKFQSLQKGIGIDGSKELDTMCGCGQMQLFSDPDNVMEGLAQSTEPAPEDLVSDGTFTMILDSAFNTIHAKWIAFWESERISREGN